MSRVQNLHHFVQVPMCQLEFSHVYWYCLFSEKSLCRQRPTFIFDVYLEKHDTKINKVAAQLYSDGYCIHHEHGIFQCSHLSQAVIINSDGLVQGCSISSALAMEILQSYTKPPITLPKNSSNMQRSFSYVFYQPNAYL